MTREDIARMTEEEEREAPPPAIERVSGEEWSWELLAEFIEGVLECAE